MEKAKVYFSRTITPENVVRLYELLGKELPGKVAVKVHSGEKGNQNFLRPEFMKPMIDAVGGTIVECNTAYDGARNTTDKHLKLLEYHGWSHYFHVDLMDAEGPDLELPIPGGKQMLSHFKGHPMGGFGGALKQLSIGCASSAGKAYIHSAGKTTDQYTLWDHVAPQDDFLESMADAASSVVNHFKGNMAFVSIMCNMSVDCDCCAVAEDPCMKDIGILSSLDPVALDQACIDLVKASNDPGREHLLERINTRHGTHTIDAAAALGFGTQDYELVCVD